MKKFANVARHGQCELEEHRCRAALGVLPAFQSRRAFEFFADLDRFTTRVRYASSQRLGLLFDALRPSHLGPLLTDYHRISDPL